jgi:predicted AAA+ superfamily ATPase
MITRYYHDLDQYVQPGRVLVLYGPRQVGKTTLIQQYLDSTPLRYRLDSGDNTAVQEVLGSRNFDRIADYVEGYDLIVVDEAQEIDGIGMGLKIIVDQHPHVRVIATGSSSFDLAQRIGEPLVGRKKTLRLYPISHLELRNDGLNPYDLMQKQDDFLLYGSYPDTLNAVTDVEKVAYLTDLVDSYLLKDILKLDNIKSPKALRDLLTLLALQIGNEVSLHELGQKLGWDIKTVDRYLYLLEECFVIVRLGGFSRNLRNEVTRKSKYYFLDTGIRNALLQQFNPLAMRSDTGALWENFLVIERLKYRSYHSRYGSSYFWRNYSQQEIDLIEEYDGELHAYEFKRSTKKITAPREWRNAYPQATFDVINPDNYLDFITDTPART